jgi:hypothetical protein
MDGLSIVFVPSQFQKVPGLDEPIVELDDGVYDGLQPGTLFAEALGLFRVVPDVGILELALHLLETLTLHIQVKDTPSERPRAPACS